MDNKVYFVMLVMLGTGTWHYLTINSTPLDKNLSWSQPFMFFKRIQDLNIEIL